MTPQHLLQLILGIVIAIGYQVAIVYAPHPAEIKSPFWRAVVWLLGTFASFFTHDGAPKTFHVPGTKQPWWDDDRLAELTARIAMAVVPPPAACTSSGEPRCTECGGIPLVMGSDKILHEAGCTSVPPRPVEVRRGTVPMALSLLIPLFALALAACETFTAVSDLAKRIYTAATAAEAKAPDDTGKHATRACGLAALAASRAALAAQDALDHQAADLPAKRTASEVAQARMKKVCDAAGVDPASVPPPAVDMAPEHPADLHPAPDMARPPGPHDMAPPAADAGARG